MKTKPTIVTKSVTKQAQTGPEEDLKAILKKADVEYIRIFLGGPEGEIPTELIYHRPIGITDLDSGEWVKSSPADVAILLSRTVNPDQKKLYSLRQELKRKQAAAKKLIKFDADGVTVLYPSGKDRNDFLKPFREKAKEDSKKAKAALAEWKKADKKSRSSFPPKQVDTNQHVLDSLKSLDKDEDAKAEMAFTEYMSGEDANADAEKNFPDNYRTMKGLSADIPQKAIGWAKDLTPSQLQQEITKYVLILTGRKVNGLGPALAKVITVTEVIGGA
jgi:hypothetical protein